MGHAPALRIFPGPSLPSRISLVLDPATQPPGSPHSSALCRRPRPGYTLPAAKAPAQGWTRSSIWGLGVQARLAPPPRTAALLALWPPIGHEPLARPLPEGRLISDRDVGPPTLPSEPATQFLGSARRGPPSPAEEQGQAGCGRGAGISLRQFSRPWSGELPMGLPVKTQHSWSWLARAQSCEPQEPCLRPGSTAAGAQGLSHWLRAPRRRPGPRPVSALSLGGPGRGLLIFTAYREKPVSRPAGH